MKGSFLAFHPTGCQFTSQSTGFGARSLRSWRPMKPILLLAFLISASTCAPATAKGPDAPASLPDPFEEELPPTADEPSERPPVLLAPGEQRLFRIPGMRKYALGSDHLKVLPLSAALRPTDGSSPGEQLLLKAVHPGLSDLWVWKADGTTEHRLFRIEKTLPAELKPGLERALGGLREVEALPSGGTVILRGTVRTLGEASRVEALLRGFPQEVRDETRAEEPLIKAALERIERWLARSPYKSELRLERRGGLVHLTGSIERAANQSTIIREVKPLYPLTRFDLEALPDDSPTVHFKVFLLELKRSRFSSLGLGWPAAQEGAFRVTSFGIEDLLQLDLTLQTLQGDGSVNILSNPELVVRAPGEAELFSGGELPIHNKSQYYATTSWKNFGLLLRLKVTHSTGTRVRLDITTEVSHLDPSIAIDKTPGIQANRMKTQVDARYGQPLLLSGLLQQGMRQQARGLPFLRSIPVLGALFGSEDYLNEKSELVAILLPSSLPPPALPIAAPVPLSEGLPEEVWK